MKIYAAHRLKAAHEQLTLRSVLGVDGNLISLGDSEALYELNSPTDSAMSTIRTRFGRPKEGRQGTTVLYVWEPQGLTLGVVLHVPKTGKPTLELYDR